MAGAPRKIERGSEQWVALKSLVLPPPEGRGLEAKAAFEEMVSLGWDVKYHTVYRCRKEILADPQGTAVSSLNESPAALSALVTEAPRRAGRFALRSDNSW